MKYLFIFLPFFCFGQGGDSTLYGIRMDIDSFRATSIDTCWEIKNGWMSLKPGCITTHSFSSSGEIINLIAQEFYVSDRKPKVVEHFKHLGAYYELRENGWSKEIFPDAIPDYLTGDIKIKGDSVFRWVEEPKWTPCDQHFGKTESYQREKLDTSEVKLLVWTGCSLTEIKATKLTGYNRDEGNLYWDKQKNTLSATKVDFLFVYISDGKWIKPSHVIKEL